MSPMSSRLFRQQFRRDLRAGRFTMEFAQSAVRCAAAHRRPPMRYPDPDLVRHQHAGDERSRTVAEGQGCATGRARHHDHGLWRRRNEGKALEGGAEALLTKPIDFASFATRSKRGSDVAA